MAATAKKDGICCNCDKPFQAGDPIRFVTETRSTNQDANNRSWTTHKPRHAHDCRNAGMERLYLLSVEDRRKQARATLETAREVCDPALFAEKRAGLEAYVAGKMAELDEEEAHVREHGHPYPECVK